MDQIAKFHEDVFEAQGAKQDVSRNDVIVAFLAWARSAFWEDKGGRPVSDEDRKRKAKQHAARLAKKQDSPGK